MAEFIEPQIYIIAETVVDDFEVKRFLESIGATSWESDATSEADHLIEIAGRLCYASWEPGINKNVTRVRQGNKTYIENIIKSRHGSVLEHSSCTFLFQNVSRVFTAELCRHRAGCAISEASLRYIRLDELKAFRSGVFDNYDMADEFIEFLAICEKWQKEAAMKFDLDSKSFEEKKIITSAMRRLAPLGLATNILWTANMRTLRHVIELRTSRHAEEEIRHVFLKVGHMITKRYPHIFGDFILNEFNEWTTPNSKI